MEDKSNSCSNNELSGSGGGFAEDYPPSRLCQDCAEPISPARLAAVPTAARCTLCTAAAGDVPKIKRFDEFVGEEPVSTYYKTPSPYLRMMVDRDQQGLFAIPPAVEEEKDAVAVASTLSKVDVYGEPADTEPFRLIVRHRAQYEKKAA